MQVFLIEGDAETRRELRRVLRCFGFDLAGEASDGAEAMRKLRTVNPDLILTEYGIAGIDGISLVGQLRARGVSVPVIMLSCSRDLMVAQAAMEFGVNRYLIKPVKAEELIQAIERVCLPRALAA